MQEIESRMIKWQAELAEEKGMTVSGTLQNRPKPWKRKDNFQSSDVTGKMHIVLGDGIYVDALNLMPRLLAYDHGILNAATAFGKTVVYVMDR